MKVHLILGLVGGCALAAGCRQDPYLTAHIEMMNAEKRALEDRVYELEYEGKTKEDELKKLRSENQQLRKESGGASAETLPRALAPPEVEIPEQTPTRPQEADTEELKPPTVEPGVPVEPAAGQPSAAPAYPLLAPQSSAAQASVREKLPAAVPGAANIAEIYIRPDGTGGRNFDQQPGDDGVALVVEPLNRDKTYVPSAGPVTVVLLDSKEVGQNKRVARWELDASEVSRYLRNSEAERGIYLELHWPQKPPRHTQLDLFVRYVTVDGRALEADRPISIRLPDPSTPSTADVQLTPPAQTARPQWSPYR